MLFYSVWFLYLFFNISVNVSELRNQMAEHLLKGNRIRIYFLKIPLKEDLTMTLALTQVLQPFKYIFCATGRPNNFSPLFISHKSVH